MSGLLNTDEAAAYLRMSERKLYELVAAGSVPCSKVTGRWLFPKTALDRWVAASDWIEHLTGDPAIRSNTSVCLQFADRSDEEANKARQKAIVKLLEAEDAAYDIGAYRDAPPGIRIWCGATVDTGDIEKLGPWLDWAWGATA